ncbi:MAG: hypothetical protein ACREMA_15185, partial [Longimicrobiales bacterium]
GLNWSTAHSSFVQLGAELGIPGLIAFLMLLFKAYQSATRPVAAGQSDPESLRTRALGQALAASLVGYLVAGFFLSQAYSAFLYVLFGMITALDANRPAPVVQASVAPAAPQPVRGFGRGGLVTGQARTPPALLDSPAN